MSKHVCRTIQEYNILIRIKISKKIKYAQYVEMNVKIRKRQIEWKNSKRVKSNQRIQNVLNRMEKFKMC